MSELYDRIGATYSGYRRPDRRIAEAILESLGRSDSVVNVGAGSGSYEPVDRKVVAVEPSRTMIRQRSPASAPAVQAVASALPFRDGAFSAGLALLTIQHWRERSRGLDELARSARDRIVVLTWDPAADGFWLTNEYFPELLELDREIFPSLSELSRCFGRIEVRPVPIPQDCRDGFLGAYWRRPAAYLDAGIRSAISSFSRIPSLEDGLRLLANDLQSGEWQRRHGVILSLQELDLGYRLVTARLN
jgi:SAM-dependent methyltransferase